MTGKGGPLDVRHPAFRPLWRRVALVAAVLGWALFELSRGATVWALLFGAIGLYLAWHYFLAFDPKDYEPEETGDGQDGS